MSLETNCEEQDRKIEEVSLYKFKTLEEFKKGSNNFHSYFLKHRSLSGSPTWKRKILIFKRFQKQYPDLERKITQEATKSYLKHHGASYSDSIWEDLFVAYKKMVEIINNDPKLKKECGGDEYFLIR